jgi:hypothetical protein
MIFSSEYSYVSSALTNKNYIVTASATATATSIISQEEADILALKEAKFVSQDSANTQASLANIASENEKVPSLSYYLYVDDFVKSLVEVKTMILDPSITTGALYAYGRAKLYNLENNNSDGICSASFACSKNSTDTYTDITNYISLDNGLIVSWLTPSTILNLELDSIINGMVTECIVKATTKIGKSNFFYGKTFNLKVSSSEGKIYFYFTSTF